MSNDIEVRHECGCVLVRSNDKAGQAHRWWFDETEAGRLVFISEVIHFDDDAKHGVDGRHYVAEHDATIPPRVHEALAEDGYERIVDTDAKPLSP